MSWIETRTDGGGGDSSGLPVPTRTRLVGLHPAEEIAVDIDVLGAEDGQRPLGRVLDDVAGDDDVPGLVVGAGQEVFGVGLAADEKAVAGDVVDVVVADDDVARAALDEHAGAAGDVHDLVAVDHGIGDAEAVDALVAGAVDDIVEDADVGRLADLDAVEGGADDGVALR